MEGNRRRCRASDRVVSTAVRAFLQVEVLDAAGRVVAGPGYGNRRTRAGQMAGLERRHRGLGDSWLGRVKGDGVARRRRNRAGAIPELDEHGLDAVAGRQGERGARRERYPRAEGAAVV